MDIKEFLVYGYNGSGNLISSKMKIKIYDKRLSPKINTVYKDRVAEEFIEGLEKMIDVKSLLAKLIYNKDIKPILAYLRKDDWRAFSNLYMKTRFSNVRKYTLEDLTKFDLSIINNKNFIVDDDTVRRGDSSELFINYLPDEILIKMDYKSAYTIIGGNFREVDTNVFRYKFYEALHHMFPKNKDYWKGYMFYISNNGDGNTEDFLNNFKHNEGIVIRNLDIIFRNFMYMLGTKRIEIDQYSSLGEFYNNNKMLRFESYDIKTPPIPYQIKDGKVIFTIYSIIDNNILSSDVEISARDKVFTDNEIIKPLTKHGLKYLLLHSKSSANLDRIFNDILSYSDDIGELIPFIGNNKMRWETLVGDLIIHMQYLDKNKLRNKKYKKDLLHIINNDNVVINEQTLRHSMTSISSYPQEFILRFEPNIVYKLLREKVFVNIDVLKYKVYEFLHKVFPHNTDYWKNILSIRFNKDELIEAPNKATNEADIENFSKQLLNGIKCKDCRSLLYKILIFLTFDTSSDKSSDIKKYYKKNKNIIEKIDISDIENIFSKESIIKKINSEISKNNSNKYIESSESDDDYERYSSEESDDEYRRYSSEESDDDNFEKYNFTKSDQESDDDF